METYKLVKKIGQGSFGEVWLVKGSSTQKQYVLKQINLQHASKREQRAAHLEVKLLSTLKHPNLVSYLDSFYNSKGSLFIVMGYCENGDLYKHIRSQNRIQFSEKQIIEWLIQICMALKYLHDKKILHRDLKTQNIFLTRNKLIRVGDLGIARVLDRTTAMATTMISTPYYMSPEIFCNMPYNHKSDIWALGCCMYEAATLEHAFHAGSFMTLVQKVLNRMIPGIHDQYSQEFHDIVFSMLSIDPDQRPSVTDILLNSYIRNHIVTFLEESKSNSKLISPKSPKPSVSGEESNRAGSTWSDSSMKYRLRTPKQDGAESLFSSVEHVVQTPDINGNGDGNDNSQQRRAVNSGEYSGNLVEAKDYSRRKLNSSELKHDLPPLLDTSSHANECKNEPHELHSTNNIHDSKAAKLGSGSKMGFKASRSAAKEGQTSLNFLRNLTYSVNNLSNYTLPSCSTKNNNYHTFWDCGNLPAISDGIPCSSTVSQNTFQFDCKHKRFKSNAKFKSRNVSEPKVKSESVSNKVRLMMHGKQKESIACPKIVSASEKNHQLTAYKGSKIPIFNSSDQKVAKDLSNSSGRRHLDALFPNMSPRNRALLKRCGEDCSSESNNIDGSLLQKIINCNIKSKTMSKHLNSSARQKRREKENRKAKAQGVEQMSIDLESSKENVDNGGAEVQMCFQEDAAERMLN